MKKRYKNLSIKGITLDNEQLQKYMEKTATSHGLKKCSDKSTYPIPRLKENFRFIEKTYILLNEHLKINIDIYPAGEWLLDNFYIIEETVKTISKELPIKKYKELPGIEKGQYQGYSRIYVVASEIIAYTDGKINDEIIKNALLAYQKRKSVSMEEIWTLCIFMQISLLENIRGICEKIYYAQIQKSKVESIIERVIEKKDAKSHDIRQEKYICNFENSYKDIKYPFIEYMSYKLKQYGKKGLPYLNILEEEVNKMGITISEVIQKEHFDIATKKVSIGNSIISIKELLRVNMLSLFEETNGVEEILKQDPSKVYEKMDYKTKELYRNKIKEVSEKTKTSEIYIAQKALELSKKYFKKNNEVISDKKAHIGYYLIADGNSYLMRELGCNIKNEQSNKKRIKRYVMSNYIISIALSVFFGIFIFYNIYKNIFIGIISLFLIYIPISEIVMQMINYILSKYSKPKVIPRLDFSKGIPEQYKTFVVVPTIIKDAKKVKEIMRNLEVYYIANKSDNIYFVLLADVTSSKNKEEDYDKDIISVGMQETGRLNNKYKSAQGDLSKFHFLYRERKWNSSEKCYLGWERKRGLLDEFNNFLINGNDKFRINTITKDTNKSVISNIKYVITLDSDTKLVLGTGFELIGTMAHILNIPVMENGIVKEGHGIIQPRVAIDLESSRKSLFSKIYGGLGGTDLYANAISDVYQDVFDEGIFSGKGIYDVKVFNKILHDEIPENTVLSHDLLEGSYLRAGFASDILLIDSYPFKYKAYTARLSRWIRGDWQIVQWLKNTIKIKSGRKKVNPLNVLSKFKIIDNIRRSAIPIFIVLNLLFANLLQITLEYKFKIIIIVSIVSYVISNIIYFLNIIIFRKNIDPGLISAHKNITNTIGATKANILRCILEISFLPDKAYTSLSSIIKAIYRMKISKQNLLEWTTAEEAEKNSKTDMISYYKSMFANVVLGLIFFIIGVSLNSVFNTILGIVWILGPMIACNVSRENIEEPKVNEITKTDKEYLIEIGNRTWNFFKDLMNEENNFLPPDNYQEDRKQKVANRTSPTNIGLGMLSVISAYDLKYINLEECLIFIERTLNTVSKLQKWNGHLYNWYNTKTLEPLFPRYVSSVDSGNFIGYLYTLKQFLLDFTKADKQEIADKFEIIQMIETINNIIESSNFGVLFDEKKRLFSIGFNVEENKLTDSYYDLLASEARQTSLIAIAKKDISSKHWKSLSRTLTSLNKYKGLISWSGTAFEYLMPNINIKRYEQSLLDESCKFMIMSQIEYAKRLGIPWGISESAFNLRDFNYNYQYKAFGIPWLALKRGMEDETVISPYSIFLSLNYIPKQSIRNLKTLGKEVYDKYGFYEAIDYTISRLKYGQNYEVVKTYMAHHQGLTLLSINNLINNNIIVNRFSTNPEIEAVDILLQERMPQKAIITKEKKERIKKQKIKNYENYIEKVYTRINNNLKNTNTISNGSYTVCTDDKGRGFSKYKNILINRYKKTSDYNQGIFFYIKHLNNKKAWANYYNIEDRVDKYNIHFSPDNCKFVRIDGDIETTTKIVVSPDEPVEIRRLEIKNNGYSSATIETTSFFEPVLSTASQDYAHEVFNNLFLNFQNIEKDKIVIERRKRGEKEKDIYLGVSLYTENETIGDFEYEIDKEKFIGKGNIGIPDAIKDSKPYSKNIGLVTDPIIAMKRTLKIEPTKKIILDLIICISNEKQEIKELLSKYENTNMCSKIFELSKAKVEAENVYLGIKGNQIEIYQKLLGYLLLKNPIKKLNIQELPKRVYSQSELWKYGISGDIPILLVKIKDINDINIIYELLKAYEFFKAKNINVDLIILNIEAKSYEQYGKFEIETAILNSQLGYLKNNGIFVINANEINREDIDLLYFRSNVIIDASLGELGTQLNDLEEDYIKSLSRIGEEAKQYISEKDEVATQIDFSKYKYYNEYGGFSEDGLEYNIKFNKNNKLPTVWSMILANKNFGTVITQNLGGFTWHKNSRLNRLTAWANSPVIDIPSEIIYIKDKENGKVWTLSENLNNDNQDYYLTYGFGYVKFKTLSNNILQELDIFVPKEDNVKVNILKLKNMLNKKRALKLIYYAKAVLGEDEINTDGYIDVKRESNIIIAKNLYTDNFKNSIMYVSSSEQIKSYTGNKKFFIGDKDIKMPNGINRVKLDDESGLGENSCVAIEIQLELEPYEAKEVIFTLGQEDSLLDVKNISYKYSKISNCIEELNKVKQFWYELLTKIQIKTPLESMNIMLNGWSIYQTITSRLWARSGYYQSGGAIGFRDQLQDTLGIKLLDINFMKSQILLHCRHQFIEGDVEHWWHEETRRGIRTRFSDDLLWLCYVINEYINYTGDYSILDIEEPYLEGEVLEEGIDEKYDIYLQSEKKEKIYLHCIRAIEKSLDFGEHGLPKIGSGDWNDGFNTVGNKKRGESIWLGFFMYYILENFIPICKIKHDEKRAIKYEEIKEKLKKNLNVFGWDGRWFKRAYTDNGEHLGSIENEECRIDSISQSWGVISNAAENDKKFISMESLENHLIDTENGIVKLLDPPFSKTHIEPGYIKSYLPGVRENGGQYTHAAIWAIIAYAKLGFGQKAIEYYRMINPIEHSRTKEESKKYKVEPYIISADVYGSNNLIGRGGWTWYTGSSSWFYKAGIEDILGLKIENNMLSIEPCIPKEWKEYSIRYRYGNSIYNIRVKNMEGKNTGVSKFIFNNIEINEHRIRLEDNNNINEIEIIM